MKLALKFLAKLLRAARFFVIYFTSVARGAGRVQEKIWAPKKVGNFFFGQNLKGKTEGIRLEKQFGFTLLYPDCPEVCAKAIRTHSALQTMV